MRKVLIFLLLSLILFTNVGKLLTATWFPAQSEMLGNLADICSAIELGIAVMFFWDEERDKEKAEKDLKNAKKEIKSLKRQFNQIIKGVTPAKKPNKPKKPKKPKRKKAKK